MFLREKIHERQLLKKKISELTKKLEFTTDNNIINTVTSNLFDNISKLQQLDLIIYRINSNSSITFGNSEISLEAGIKFRKYTSAKIEILTKLINFKNDSIDIVGLMEQRDKLIIEFQYLDRIIKSTDWSIQIDD